MARKPTIYPEVINPGDWQVEEWRPDGTGAPCPCTDNGGRRMFVPAGASKFAKEVRFHELLHVRYSPDAVPEIPGVAPGSILAAEDCRVNLMGARIREHDALGSAPMPDALQMVTTKTEREMARLTAACLGYTSTPEWCENLRGELYEMQENDALPEWAQEHARMLRRAIAVVQRSAEDVLTGDGENEIEDCTFEDAINLARWLDENFSDDAPGPNRPGKGKGSDETDEDGEYSDPTDGNGGDASGARWGEMRVVTPPLPVNHPNALGRRTSACKQGARIQHFNRLVTGEIFGRPRKRATPDVVLVDNSGSMGWDTSKLHEIVKQLPVGIVASYDGANGQGELKILARDGRMVRASEVEAQWGGNEVDGPALRWLANQKGRKLWVSDQGVCSDVCDDDAALGADCQAIVKAAGIRVCLTTDPKAIMRALKGR